MAEPDARHPMVKAIESIAARMLSDLGEDHNTGRQMQAEMNRLRMKAEALDRVNANRSPLDTPAAHAVKVAKMARTFDTEITAVLNRTLKIWGDGYQDVERRIGEKVNLTPDAFAGEIRAAFRGLSPKARAELVNQLVTENRGPELAAIVKAPSILTGISDEERAGYEKMILARHASAELDEIAHLEEAFQAVSVATRAAGDMAKGFIDPSNLSRIESAAAAADEAREAFQAIE